jgi:hypothetical protein
MMAKADRWVLIGLITSILVGPVVCALGCEYSGWILPAKSSMDTIILDSSEWLVHEEMQGDRFFRRITRLDQGSGGATPEISSEEALRISKVFFSQNGPFVGVPREPEMYVETGENQLFKIRFVAADYQYCSGMRVVGTIAGVLDIQTGTVSELGFLWYPEIVVNDTDIEVGEEEVEDLAGVEPEQVKQVEKVIIPKGGGTFAVAYDIKQKNGSHSFIEAKTGNTVNQQGKVVVDRQLIKRQFPFKVVLGLFVLVILSFAGYSFFNREKS